MTIQTFTESISGTSQLKNNFDAYKLVGLYQWVWNIDGGFNWYAGPGAGIAQVDFDDDFFDDNDFDDSETYVFLAGDIGIEYNFDFPLLLSLDFRPEFGFGDYDEHDAVADTMAVANIFQILYKDKPEQEKPEWIFV